MKIVVSPNPYRDKQFKHARQACQILKEAGAEVSLCLPFDVDRSFEIPSDLRFREIQKEIRTADMLICFGGDGTILHSSKIATEHGLPILGVNIGTMGFIAELEASEMELLRKIPQGDYTVEPRTMLDVSVVSGKQTLFHETALNDAVITKGAIARVVQLSITCDGVEATSFSGDGVILCTPTGSTAYSMSAGGPIVEPSAKNFLITPICAHAMLAKSIVVAPEPRDRSPGRQGRAAQRLPLRRRRTGLPAERRRRDRGKKLAEGHPAGPAEGYQLFRDPEQEIH